MKFSKTQVLIIGCLIFIIASLLFSLTWDIKIIGDTLYSSGNVRNGGFHSMINIIVSILIITFAIILMGKTFFDGSLLKRFYSDDNSPKTKSNKKFNYNKIIYWILGIVAIIFAYNKINGIAKGMIMVFNTNKQYTNFYQQKVEEKKGFYDKLWKTYLQKEKITNINRETFLITTKMIMENRKDGQSITWKWLQENQQIPYNEFVTFYEDLSAFITNQREDYFKIEQVCQKIANDNNTLLDTFPNNIYNKVLGCKRIQFEYGFLSDSTNTVFDKKIENIGL